MNRRGFLAAGALTACLPATRRVTALGKPRGELLRLGLIGAGSRGKELARQFGHVPGVELTAVCDIYPPRFAELAAITGARAAQPYRDHQALLARPDLDAVVVATPLWLHREHVTAALASGRHVYAEKSLGHTVAHCESIVAAVGASQRLLQVGHQYRYAPWYARAVERVQAGEIGAVTQIEAYWHRNNDWRRPVPKDAQGRIDPALERLINWRMYRQYSGGLLAELGSHAIDLANWVFGGPPESVIGSGGIDSYKDGRETADNVKAIFRYPGGRTFSFSAITTNAQLGLQQWIFGTRGSVALTQEGASFFKEKGLLSSSERAAVGTAPHQAVDQITGASYRPGNENPGGLKVDEIRRPAGGLEADVTYLACRAFCDGVRAGQRPFADERVGWRSGISAALANLALDQGRRIDFRDHVRQG